MDMKLQNAVNCAGVGGADGGNGNEETRMWGMPTSGRGAEEERWCVGGIGSSKGGDCKYGGGVMIGEGNTAVGSSGNVVAREEVPCGGAVDVDTSGGRWAAAAPASLNTSGAGGTGADAAAAMALSAIAADAQQLSVESSRSVPAPFLTKTYQLVDDSSSDHIVSWGDDGTTFVVWRPPEFARDLLPNYFKHNNFSSFVRQLNTYGFRKIVPDRWEFANDFFRKGERHLLCEIHRRKASAAGHGGRCSPTSGSSADDSAMAASNCGYSLWDLPSPVSTNSANQALVHMMHHHQYHPAVAVGMLAQHPAAAAQNIYAASGGGAATAAASYGHHGGGDNSSTVSQYSMYDENDRLRRDNAVLLAELLHTRKVYREVLLYIQHLSGGAGGASAVYYPRPSVMHDGNDSASVMPPLPAVPCESPAAAAAISAAAAIMPAPPDNPSTINACRKFAILSSPALHNRTIDGDVSVCDVASSYTGSIHMNGAAAAAVSAAAVADYVDSVVDRNRNASRAGIAQYPESAHPFSSYSYGPPSVNGRLGNRIDGGRSDRQLEPHVQDPPASAAGSYMPLLPISSFSDSGRATGSSSDRIGGANSEADQKNKGHENGNSVSDRKYDNDERKKSGNQVPSAEVSDVDGDTIPPPAPRLFGVALQSGGGKKRHYAEIETDRMNNKNSNTKIKEDADRRLLPSEDDNNSSASNISSSVVSPLPLMMISGCHKNSRCCISDDNVNAAAAAPMITSDYDVKLQPAINTDLHPQTIISTADNAASAASHNHNNNTNNHHRRTSSATPWIAFGFTPFRDETGLQLV